MFLKKCEQFKVIFKNSRSLNTFAVDIRKKVLTEIKRRENVQEIHRDIKKKYSNQTTSKQQDNQNNKNTN